MCFPKRKFFGGVRCAEVVDFDFSVCGKEMRNFQKSSQNPSKIPRDFGSWLAQHNPNRFDASHMTHRGFFQTFEEESGIGKVLVVRNKSGGRFEAGVFLVDRYCLGVKDAFAVDTSQFDTVEEMLEAILHESGYEEVSPAKARKYVESAVAYARHLGFAPHRDYSKGARVFGGIRAAECEEEFVFGKDGKPFYIQGPYDSPEMADRIVSLLEAKLGKGGYEYIVLASEPGDFDDEEDEDPDFDEDEDDEEDSDDEPQDWVVAFEYPRVGKKPSPELLKYIEDLKKMEGDMPDPEISTEFDELADFLRGFFLPNDEQISMGMEMLAADGHDISQGVELFKKVHIFLKTLIWNDAAGVPISDDSLNEIPPELSEIVRTALSEPEFIDSKNLLKQTFSAMRNPPRILCVDSAPDPGRGQERILAILSFVI